MRRTVAWALCSAIIFSPSALASPWAEFDKHESADHTERYEWDAESVATKVDNPALAAMLPISVTWRHYTTSQLFPSPEEREIRKSRIFCGDLGISTYYRECVLLRKDGQPGVRIGSPVESAPSDNPTAWATWSSTDGKLIRAVCQAVSPAWVPEFLTAQMKECIGKTVGMCSPSNRDLASSISLLLYRKQQAANACTTALDAPGKVAFSTLADEAIADVLVEAGKCQDTACRERAITWMISGLNSDLERAARGLQCEAYQQRASAIKREKQTAKGMEGMKAYLACAASKTPALDDGFSPPESIATALHSACQGIFDAAANQLYQHPDSAKLLASQFRPKLVEMVLQYRAALRAPKKPATRPETGHRVQS